MNSSISSKNVLVLGVSGYIGEAVFKCLRLLDVSVVGTVRTASTDPNLLPLDLAKVGEVERFPWREFSHVIDCTGLVRYESTFSSLRENLRANVSTPLQIIRALRDGQRYLYLSTHAVLLPDIDQNAYSISKGLFEACIETRLTPDVTICRVPGIFGGGRKDGLVYAIKNAYETKEAVAISAPTGPWHAMYRDRVAQIIAAVVRSDVAVHLITIGYPTTTSVASIIDAANEYYGAGQYVDIEGSGDVLYEPDLGIQNSVIDIPPTAFRQDLITYFST